MITYEKLAQRGPAGPRAPVAFGGNAWHGKGGLACNAKAAQSANGPQLHLAIGASWVAHCGWGYGASKLAPPTMPQLVPGLVITTNVAQVWPWPQGKGRCGQTATHTTNTVATHATVQQQSALYGAWAGVAAWPSPNSSLKKLANMRACLCAKSDLGMWLFSWSKC